MNVNLMGLRMNKNVALTKLKPMMIVSLKLCDKMKFAIHVEGMMQP